MKVKPETALVRACIDYLNYRGIFAWRNNTTGVYDPARKTFRSFTGLKGVSDVLGCTSDGRFVAVECKAKDNTLAPEQIAFLNTIQAKGGIACVAYTLDDVQDALTAAGIVG